jgi:hypothetical protein
LIRTVGCSGRRAAQKPGDLPVDRLITFDTVTNLKTTKLSGLRRRSDRETKSLMTGLGSNSALGRCRLNVRITFKSGRRAEKVPGGGITTGL